MGERGIELNPGKITFPALQACSFYLWENMLVNALIMQDLMEGGKSPFSISMLMSCWVKCFSRQSSL